MSAIAQSPTVNRPTTITAATVLLALLGAVGLLAAPLGSEEGGAVFIAISLIVAGLRFLAAYGVWRFRRWAAILGFVVSLLDSLLAAPGLFFAPEIAIQLFAAIGIVCSIATMVLLVLPTSRRAYA